MKTLFMETTEIKPEKTVQEIQACLGKYGVNGIHMEYDKGEVVGVEFGVDAGDRRLYFALPCRWMPIYVIFVNRFKRTVSNDEAVRLATRAKRVAWRQVLRWVEAQLAFVHSEMARIEEVFMPYMVVGPKGETLFQKLQASQFLIEAPKK